jgi:hypothetical protein
MSDNDKSAEEMAAMFADNSFEATRLPDRAANFIRGFCLWGLSLPLREAKTLVLIMIRVMVQYKKQGKLIAQPQEDDDATELTH